MADDRIKRPAYQWNVVDADGDEVFQLMTYEQQGIYRALLDRQWREGSIPADPKLIFILLPKLKSFERFKTSLWPLVSAKFAPHADARLQNARMERYRAELDRFVKIQAENGAKGAVRRWGRHSKPMPTPVAKHSTLTTTTSTTVVKEQPQAPAEKAPSPTREFLGWFQGEYKARRNGATYFVRWDAHSAIVKRLLTAFPVDRLKKHAQILLSTDEEWTTGTDRGIEILSAKINWLEERLCAWEAKRKAREAV